MSLAQGASTERVCGIAVTVSEQVESGVRASVLVLCCENGGRTEHRQERVSHQVAAADQQQHLLQELAKTLVCADRLVSNVPARTSFGAPRVLHG